MNPRALLPILLAGCHTGYLSLTDPPEPEDTAPVVDPDLVSTWVGDCEITEVARAATEDAEDGITIHMALEVTGQQVVCSSDLGDAAACYTVIAPAVNADWGGAGEGELNPEGTGPIDMLIRVEAEGYCDASVKTCVPSWDLYLWGAVVDGVYQGDCQSISTGSYGNYPVTWGSGSFALDAGSR